jgi:transcription-repair coupling factor (superfamily II helicase)
MGLAQLHQLRGRVGRSPRRAYAYFCFRGGKAMSETALKRLEAIREFTEFGSGFRIAMRDLEIRGAGNVLGAQQHGHMEAVGYDMYIKLLNEAVCEENGIKPVEKAECTVDLNISAHIPERYIESLPARLGIYKRIAAIENEAQKSDVLDELIDRFGEPPRAVLGLIDIALLRRRAAALGIYEITEQGNSLILRVKEVNEEQIAHLMPAFGKRIALRADEQPYYEIKMAAGTPREKTIAEIASYL